MELTEKERLMLVEKKEEILKLTKEILDIEKDPKQAVEVKKKMTSILSLISTIASYSKSKNTSLDYLLQRAKLISDFMDNNFWKASSTHLEIFCNAVNSIEFDFTKREMKIPDLHFHMHLS